MSLSKNNLDKLNNFVNNNSAKDEKIFKSKIKNNNNQTTNSNLTQDANNIFYSLIDNAETLNETTEINSLLRKSEKDCNDHNSKNTDFSKQLTPEDILYDEFKYLLED